MGDSKLVIKENSVYEIYGNLAFQDWSTNKTHWEAGEMELAFVGRVVTDANHFFQGYLIRLYQFSTFHTSLNEAEVPVIGRFVKGRNGSTSMILATMPVFDNRLWIKKKINEGGCGIITAARNGDGEVWGGKLSFDGYFNCGVSEAYTPNEDDKTNLTSIVRLTYSRRLSGKKYVENAKKFVETFGSIEDRLLDLLDEHEGVSADISYPDKK